GRASSVNAVTHTSSRINAASFCVCVNVVKTPQKSDRRSTMTTQEVADKLVKLCSEGKFHEAMEALYSPDIVSMEAGAPPGGSREAKGLAAVRAKGEWW